MVVLRHALAFTFLFLLVCTSSGVSSTNIESVNAFSTYEQPIVVIGDLNFSSAYWQGDGSASSPYILEDIQIAINATCLSISNTSSYFIIRNCWFVSYWYENYAIGYEAVIFNNVTNGVIQDCDIDSSAGSVYLLHCSNVNMTENILSSEHSQGVFVFDSVDCHILENYFENSGIEGLDALALNISNNIVTDSRSQGMHLHNVSSSYIDENSILSSNSHGIAIDDSISTIISMNEIRDSGAYGILASTFSCSFTGNTITNSQGYGLDLEGSENSLYENLFLHNKVTNARDRGTNNTWERNYWDDYVGIGWYSIDGTSGSDDISPQGDPGILTPVQIALIVLVPIAILTILLVMKRRTP